MRSFRSRAFGPWLAVITLTAAGAAAAAGYALTAPKHYRATAQLIVSPVPEDDTTFTGIDVLRDSGGKRTAAASAAALVRAPLVADAVRALLGLRRSRDSLLHALDAHVVDSSDVVAVTVEDTSANGAAQLANAFADTLVNERAASFQSEVGAAVRRYAQQLAGMTKAERASPAGAQLTQRLVALQGLQGSADPTLKHAGQAAAPTSATGWSVPELTALGAAAGAVLGLLVALALLSGRKAAGRKSAEYDHVISEEAAERLADRLEQRLAARETALAARERDLQHAVDELRAAQAAEPAPAPAPAPPPAPAGDDLAADDLAGEELAHREAALGERVAAVTRRELALARRAAELAVREAEPEPEPEPEPEREPEPEPEPEPAPAAPAAVAGERSYNLLTLERLVEEGRVRFPERAEEWSSYLYFLREYAAADGAVPSAFDALIQETFAELVS